MRKLAAGSAISGAVKLHPAHRLSSRPPSPTRRSTDGRAVSLDSTDPRLDRAFGTMTVPDNTVPPISKLKVLHGGEKRLRFQLDRGS